LSVTLISPFRHGRFGAHNGLKSDIAPRPESARFRLKYRSENKLLFDHFVGAGRQKMRDCDLAELTRVKRANFPKAICA
jgi:hypothetical protein